MARSLKKGPYIHFKLQKKLKTMFPQEKIMLSKLGHVHQ